MLAAKLVLCSLFTLGMSRLGTGGALLSLVLWGYLFAPDLIGIVGWLRRGQHQRTWRDVEGRYYEFKGVPVLVEEDAEGRRWIRLRDLGRALGDMPRESALRVLGDDARRRFDGEEFLHADACLRYLSQRQSDRAIRLRSWVERVIWHPSGAQRRGK